MKVSKIARRNKIRLGIRQKIEGTAERPRLCVYRSNKGIYCQLINDVDGTTLASASSREAEIGKKGSLSEQAKKVGETLAQRAKKAKVEKAVFDRSGYLYHGRIKALAEGAREGGLAL